MVKATRNEEQQRTTWGVGSDYAPGMLEAHDHWQVIWPRVVARAWADEKFKRALLKDPETVIEKEFNYKLSPEMDLEIIAAKKSESYDPSNTNDPWDALPPLKLTLYLPPAPPVEQQAVAITVYQDTGRTYPFTCC